MRDSYWKEIAICLPETWVWQLADLEFAFPLPHSVPLSIWNWMMVSLAIEDPVLCSAGLTGVPLAWRGTAFLLLTHLPYDFSAFCTWLTLIPIQAQISCPGTPPHHPPFIRGVLFHPVGCKWTRNYLSWNPVFSVFYNPWSPSHFIVVHIVLLSKRSLVKFWWKSFAWLKLEDDYCYNLHMYPRRIHLITPSPLWTSQSNLLLIWNCDLVRQGNLQ